MLSFEKLSFIKDATYDINLIKYDGVLMSSQATVMINFS